MAKARKICNLCYDEINEDTKYGKFRKNTLFSHVGGPDDDTFWTALIPRYICASCLENIQAYCQEHKIEK